MRKKAMVLAAIFGLAVAVWALSHFVRIPFMSVHPHEAIPSHTAMFLGLENSHVNQIVQGKMPKLLNELFLPDILQSDLKNYLSIYGKTLPFIKGEKLFVSINPTRKSGIDLLYIIPCPRSLDLKSILSLDKVGRLRSSVFQGSEVFTATKNGHTFSFAKYRNLLLFARHAYLVENAISQLISPRTALCSDSNFRAAKVSSNNTPSGYEIAVNINELGPQFAPLIEPSELEKINQMGQAGSWVRMVWPAENNATVWLANFTPSPNLPLIAANKKAPAADVSTIFPFLPDDLMGLIWLSQNSFQPTSNVEAWEKNFAPWAGASATIAFGEQLGKSPIEKFFLLKTNDPKLAESSINQLASETSPEEAFEVQLFTVSHLDGMMLSQMFGLPEMFEGAYATVLGEYVLFGNTKSGMERWLVKYLAGQTLSKKVSFLKSIDSSNLNGQSFFYFESGSSWQLASQFLSEKRGSFFDHNPFIFNHLTGLGKWNGDTHHIEFSIPQKKNEEESPAGILWRLPLAGRALGVPIVSKNPNSSEMEIVIKDDLNNIYLVSNNGRIVWQQNFDESILSEVTEIDLRNDGDRQFVFNTQSAIHIIDERGENIAGFPLEFQVPATNGVTVIDFFQSHDYRFFVACENGNAYGFNERGSPVEGWRPKRDIGLVSLPLLHFQAQGKDFLVLLNGDGELEVCRKNGTERFPTVKFENRHLQTIDYQSHISFSRIVTCDDSGQVFVTNFKGDDFKLKLKVGNNEGVKFTFSDVVGDSRNDYSVLSGKDLAVYYYEGKEFKKAWSCTLPSTQNGIFTVEVPSENRPQIGTFSLVKKRIYLLDGKGEIVSNFPLEGTTPFVINDLLSNGEKIVVTGNGRSICAYSID